MSKDILQKYIEDGEAVLDRMERDSRRGNAVSRELLEELIRRNEDTEYGRKYGFREIRSYEDFAARVPLSEYEDYEEYIERMMCFNEKNLITADETVYYAHTSGTTGTSKMIPCTQRALDVFFAAGYERVFGLYDRTLREKGGKGMPAGWGLVLIEKKAPTRPSGPPTARSPRR